MNLKFEFSYIKKLLFVFIKNCRFDIWSSNCIVNGSQAFPDTYCRLVTMR